MDELASLCIGWLYYVFMILVGSTIARVVLPVVSLGKIYVQPRLSGGGGFNWLGCRRDERGRIELDELLAGLIGLSLIASVSILTTWLVSFG